MVGDKRVYMISHTTTNTNLMLPTPSKRHRGRPSGSKNKPKPPIIIKENSETLMEMVSIEIPAGRDIVEYLINLAQRHQSSLTVVRGYGPVIDVTLLNLVSHTPSFPIAGPFRMISLSGTYINSNCGHVPPQFATNPSFSSFSIYLSGGHGQVFGGVLGGKVKSAGVVLITATLFKKPVFHRMVTINGTIQDIEDDDSIYGGGVLINGERVAPESSNTNVLNFRGFGVVGSDSTHAINHQTVSSHLPIDMNVMQWNHATQFNNY
ncbi:unnamed protein product [Lathyrus sativus]|nr:unnamed protein product [Lathyrus sativus]